MSVRKIIELERMLYKQGILVALTVTPDGLIIQGPVYRERLMAKSELQKIGVIVAGHVHCVFDDCAGSDMSAI